MKTYTVQLEEAENGDLMLPIPQAVLDYQDWREGDTLRFVDNGDGSFSIRNLSAPEPAIDDMLVAMLGSREFVETWWNSPNAAFGFQNPVDCDRETVYNYVLQHYVR